MSESRANVVALVVLALVAAMLGSYVYLVQVSTPADPDTYWHIATGRWVIEHRAVPTMDPFSWWGVENHRAWVPMEWLYGILAALVDKAGWAATFGFTALLAAIAAGVVYVLVRARGLSRPWALAVVALYAVGTGVFWVARPQALTFVLLPLLMLLLEKRRYLLGLLVVLVGVNVHGAIWPLYVGLWMLYVIRDRKWLWAPGALAVLATPQPIPTLMYPLAGFGDQSVLGIAEFVRTQMWNRPKDLAAFTLVILAMRRQAVRLVEGLAALSIILLAFLADRMVVWFYVIAVPLLAPYVAAGVEDMTTRALSWVRMKRGTEPAGEGAAEGAAGGPQPRPVEAFLSHRMTVAVVVGASAVLAAFLIVRGATTPLEPYRTRPQISILDYMRANAMTRAFTSYGEGGYLIYMGFPPLIDGRGDPFAPQPGSSVDLRGDYMAAWYLTMPITDFLSKYRIRWVMVEKAAPIVAGMAADSRFHAVTQTEDHILFDYTPLAAELPTPAEKAAAESSATPAAPAP